jgi:zeta-carotene isomerase
VQVAAVDEPKLHLWNSGVIRITRHPQAFGQALWCLAHTLWVGSSFMVVTSAALMVHHAFGCWHGDFRLRRKFGEVCATAAVAETMILLLAAKQGPKRLFCMPNRIKGILLVSVMSFGQWKVCFPQ